MSGFRRMDKFMIWAGAAVMIAAAAMAIYCGITAQYGCMLLNTITCCVAGLCALVNRLMQR